MQNANFKLQNALVRLLAGRLKKYGWPGAVVASGLLLYAARESMPPGTDLVGALISLFGLGQQISTSVSERIYERIGAIASKQAELVKVVDDHATHLEKHQTYLKPIGYPTARVLRPTT